MFYNDSDAYCCKVLKARIGEGRLAKGIIDERDIRKITAADLESHEQIHLFAGVAGWSLALQIAGWADDREVWTVSCPCPPFSSAGRKRPCPSCQGKVLLPDLCRTGYFVCADCVHSWLADERHLWPIG